MLVTKMEVDVEEVEYTGSPLVPTVTDDASGYTLNLDES